MPLKSRFERCYIDDNPTACIGTFSQADSQGITGHSEILHRPGKRERVGWHDTDITCEIHHIGGLEIFGVNHRRVDIGKDFKLIADTDIVAVTAKPVAHNPLAYQSLTKGGNHRFIE